MTRQHSIALHILQTLRETGPITYRDLRARIGKPRRTIYAAMQQLKERQLIVERPVLRYMRPRVVSLA